MDNKKKQGHSAITVSQSAIEQASRDIKAGITYPDFWNDRYGVGEKNLKQEQKPSKTGK